MAIDIDKLTENELIDLNNRIVARLRFLNQMRAHSQMLDFHIGDRVTFQPEGRAALFGIVTRYNRKSVTVITEGGEHWTVAPGLLRKATSTAGNEANDAKVVHLRKESLIPSLSALGEACDLPHHNIEFRSTRWVAGMSKRCPCAWNWFT
ncbi:MAG: hypothetical protein ABIP88_00595 [Candidatus Binatia bacterium]